MLKKMSLYRAINIFLVFIVAVLVLVILTGTIVAFLKKPIEHSSITGPKDGNVKVEAKKLGYSSYFLRDGKAIYSELGQLRALSSDELPATIVLNPHLEYDAENIPLQEEIVKKKERLRKVILEWFALRSWLSIETLAESEIKKEILNEINKELTLGSSTSVYFAEFKVVH